MTEFTNAKFFLKQYSRCLTVGHYFAFWKNPSCLCSLISVALSPQEGSQIYLLDPTYNFSDLDQGGQASVCSWENQGAGEKRRHCADKVKVRGKFHEKDSNWSLWV